MAVDSATANSRWNTCNDSAYPKNSRSAPKKQNGFFGFFLDGIEMARWQATFTTAASTRIPAIATGCIFSLCGHYTLRLQPTVRLTTYYPLFLPCYSEKNIALRLARRGDFDVAILLWVRDTKVHWYFSRDKNQTKPNRPTKTRILHVSLCRSLNTSHTLIPRRHAHERLLRTGRSRKDVPSYRKRTSKSILGT
jgi:hypothetical protein